MFFEAAAIIDILFYEFLYLPTYLPLKDTHLDEIANLLELECNWRWTADKLGLKKEKRDIEAGVGLVVDPTRPDLRHILTVDVLRRWCMKPHSTVHILRQVLADVSDELVREFDHRRMSEYRLYS